MDVVFAYRGRQISASDLERIRALIAAHPQASRRRLSQQLCAAWQWVQPNGTPRDMVCRGLMLGVHRAGLIELPPRRRCPPNPLAQRGRPGAVAIDRPPIRAELPGLGRLEFVQVRRSAQEPLFNALAARAALPRLHATGGRTLHRLVARPTSHEPALSSLQPAGSRGPRWRGAELQAKPATGRSLAYTRYFSCCGWRFRILLRTCSGAWCACSRPSGNASTATRSISPRPSSIRSAFRGRATGRRTGLISGAPRVRGKNDRTHRPNRVRKAVLGYPLTSRFRELCCGPAR